MSSLSDGAGLLYKKYNRIASQNAAMKAFLHDLMATGFNTVMRERAELLIGRLEKETAKTEEKAA